MVINPPSSFPGGGGEGQGGRGMLEEGESFYRRNKRGEKEAVCLNSLIHCEQSTQNLNSNIFCLPNIK